MTPTSGLNTNSFAARGARLKAASDPSLDSAAAGLESTIPGHFQKEFQAILKDPNSQSRWDEIVALGVRLKQERVVEAAARVLSIAAQAAPDASQREQAKAELSAILGAGDTGMRIEFLTSSFASEAIQPKTILPMMAGTFVGRLAGTAFSRGLAQAAPGLLTTGTGARFASGLVSLAAEAPVFAGAQWAMNGYQGDFGDVLKRSGVTLGLLKLAGGLSGETLRGLHGVGPSGVTRLQNLSGVTQAVLPQAAMFGSLLASHQLEKKLGWIQDRPGANLYTDTLASMLGLSVGARLGGKVLGGEFAKAEADLAARRENNLSRPIRFERINEWFAGQSLAAAGNAPLGAKPFEKIPQLWMASQNLDPQNGGKEKNGSGKSSTELVKTESEANLPVKALQKPLVLRDAMMVGLKTLFSIDTLTQNAKPMVLFAGLSAGFMALGAPLLGLTMFVGGGIFLIGSHVWRNVSYFLDSGAGGRSRNRIELSLNSRYAKGNQVPHADLAFVEQVNAVAKDGDWSPQVVLARQLRDRDAATVRDSLDKYYGSDLGAKLSIIIRGELKQGLPLVLEALDLKGLTNEAISYLLNGIDQLGGSESQALLETWAKGKGRVKNAAVRIAAAKALLEIGAAEPALKVLEDIYERSGSRQRHELELTLAKAKIELGRPATESRVHLLKYWGDYGEPDLASMEVLEKMQDRQLIEMILATKEQRIVTEAKEKLRSADPELYDELYPDLSQEQPERKADAPHPFDRLREKYPEIYEAIYKTRLPASRYAEWYRLGMLIWNPETAHDPRVTAKAISILQGFGIQWNEAREELSSILRQWVERGIALDANEAVLARALLSKDLAGTHGMHQVRRLINNSKLEHSPEALLEIGWALAEAGAKTEAKEIAEKLLKIPHISIEAGRLMDALDPTWDKTN